MNAELFFDEDSTGLYATFKINFSENVVSVFKGFRPSDEAELNISDVFQNTLIREVLRIKGVKEVSAIDTCTLEVCCKDPEIWDEKDNMALCAMYGWREIHRALVKAVESFGIAVGGFINISFYEDYPEIYFCLLDVEGDVLISISRAIQDHEIALEEEDSLHRELLSHDNSTDLPVPGNNVAQIVGR